MSYDSKPETRKHQERVRQLLNQAVEVLREAASQHDQSKLEEPELSGFNEGSARVQGLQYGTPEYDKALQDLRPILAHHYARNRHHPEHHPGGIFDMDLMDLLEMLADWKAAGERTKNGRGLAFSIEYNAGRFNYGDQMKALLLRTAKRLGWLDDTRKTG